MMKSRAAFTPRTAIEDEQDVARLQWDVLAGVAVVDQVIELDLDAGLLAIDDAGDLRAVAGGELAQSADREHRIEHRHALAIRQLLGTHYLADDPHQAEGSSPRS